MLNNQSTSKGECKLHAAPSFCEKSDKCDSLITAFLWFIVKIMIRLRRSYLDV